MRRERKNKSYGMSSLHKEVYVKRQDTGAYYSGLLPGTKKLNLKDKLCDCNHTKRISEMSKKNW